MASKNANLTVPKQHIVACDEDTDNEENHEYYYADGNDDDEYEYYYEDYEYYAEQNPEDGPTAPETTVPIVPDTISPTFHLQDRSATPSPASKTNTNSTHTPPPKNKKSSRFNHESLMAVHCH